MKPTDISDEAWDAATDIAASFVEWLSVPNLDSDAETVLTAVVVRALAETEARATERAALIADHFTTARNARKARELTKDQLYEAKIIARIIAATIRGTIPSPIRESAQRPANSNFATLEVRGTVS